jgi:hypothetical protein
VLLVFSDETLTPAPAPATSGGSRGDPPTPVNGNGRPPVEELPTNNLEEEDENTGDDYEDENLLTPERKEPSIGGGGGRLSANIDEDEEDEDKEEEEEEDAEYDYDDDSNGRAKRKSHQPKPVKAKAKRH